MIINISQYLEFALTGCDAIHGALLQQVIAAGGFGLQRRGLATLMESLRFTRAYRPADPPGAEGYKTFRSARRKDGKPRRNAALVYVMPVGVNQADPGYCVSWSINARPDRIYLRMPASATDPSDPGVREHATRAAIEYQRKVNGPRKPRRESNAQVTHLRREMHRARAQANHARGLQAQGLTVQNASAIFDQEINARDDYHTALRTRGEI